MSRLYRQFRDRVATVRLRRTEHRALKLDALVDAVDLRRVDVPKLLGLIDSKIDRLNSLDTRIGVATLVATILLFASLSGVDFEIEFLGIKLSGLTKLKELIFCGVSFAGLYSVVSRGSVRHLKEIRKRLFVRKHGKPAYDIYAPVFNDDMSYDFDVPLGTDRYFPTRPTMALEAVRIFLEWVPFFVLVTAMLSITVFIAFDIWDSSNLPEPWGKILVLTVYIGWALQWTISLFSHLWRFRFIDVTKEKEIQVKDPQTGEVHPVLETLIKRNVATRLMGRRIVDLVMAIMTGLALLVSTTEFDRILEFVRRTLDVGPTP